MNKTTKLELPLLVMKESFVFPFTTQTVDAGRLFAKHAIQSANAFYDGLIFVTTQKKANIESPKSDDIYKYGVICRLNSVNNSGKSLRVRITAVDRVELSKIKDSDDKSFLLATGKVIRIEGKLSKEQEDSFRNQIMSSLSAFPDVYNRLCGSSNSSNILLKNDLQEVCFNTISSFRPNAEVSLKALKVLSFEELVNLTLSIFEGEKAKRDVETKLAEDVRASSEQNQKEYYLREKLKAIKKELGEPEGVDDSVTIAEKLKNNPYPEHVANKVKAELKRLDMMPQSSLESSLIQAYIDTLMALPWYQKTTDNEDLIEVEKILDEDHYGLDKVKKRIVEYLAVKKLTGNLKSPILCFFGPPGVGKTSLGRSIARALGRKFVKSSLGGISDEAEIRGHRRTYVGSMPGRIISGMKKVGVNNPVFLLDEVDKLASSYKGDPASALLEVLDPEQNFQFNDNYVEEPFDLSDVLFICTANDLQNIPGPLRDRLELIEVNSYTEIEKLEIAKQHLIKKQIEANGLKSENVSFSEEGLLYIIRHYTRESGVRNLERAIASCIRKVAVQYVKDSSMKKVNITPKKVKEFLGIEIFEETRKEKDDQIGVVTGLAYTQFGGDILPIEVTYFPGKGGLILTGHLGDVMKESATIALGYVRANSQKYSIDSKIFDENVIHIHVPEGAVPKDGPSAGVAITTAIISALSKKKVSANVAMTGEVTLRGLALPIGGLREKTLAALRSGIKTILVPVENKKAIDELPKEVISNIDIVYMKTVDDALKVALVEEQ